MEEQEAQVQDATPWPETLKVPLDHWIPVTIGPLSLSFSYRPGEWFIAWEHRDPQEAAPVCSTGAAQPVSDEQPVKEARRFLTGRTDGAIRLRRELADRPVVARPELPAMVPSGDEVSIFVSTPIWVRVELEFPLRQLLEIPTLRPSDTWFGPNTRRGTVAYASQTAARLNLANLPAMAHRAITRITVRNETETVLPIDRICVPMPNLTLYADADGALWTSPLLAVYDGEKEPARVRLDDEVPADAKDPTKVAEPRERLPKSVFSRALHVLSSEVRP